MNSWEIILSIEGRQWERIGDVVWDTLWMLINEDTTWAVNTLTFDNTSEKVYESLQDGAIFKSKIQSYVF